MKANTAASTPFLSTLLEMINQGHCVFDDGNLVLGNAQLFASSVLPRYFKHGNFSSFQRQLYYFSWRKKVVRKGGSKTGKTSAQVFYNHTLKGQDPTKILDLKRKSSSSTGSKKATRTAPVSDQSLSKYSGADLDDLAALTKILPPKIVSWTEPSIDRRRSIGGGADGSSTVGDGDDGRIGGSGYGRSGGRPGGSGESRRLWDGGIPSSFSAGRGGGETSLGLNPGNAGRSFCGWQSPPGHANGGHGVGGGVGRDSSSVGESAASGKRQDCRAYGWDRSPTKRRQDDGGGSGGGGGESVDESISIQNLLTAVQIEIEDRRSTSAGLCSETFMPSPSRTPWVARTATIDPPSVPIPDPLPLPPLVAATIQANRPAAPNNNHAAVDATSLRLVFASSTDHVQPVCPPEQLGVNVGTPTRSFPFTSSRGAEAEGKKFGSFDVKNFGDSLLGSGGDGARGNNAGPRYTQAAITVSSSGDKKRAGQGRGPVPSSTDGSTRASSAAQLGSDMVTKAFGSGGGCGGAAAATLLMSFPDPEPGQSSRGVLSPNRVFPLTPSPLSLDRPEDRLLGLW